MRSPPRPRARRRSASGESTAANAVTQLAGPAPRPLPTPAERSRHARSQRCKPTPAKPRTNRSSPAKTAWPPQHRRQAAARRRDADKDATRPCPRRNSRPKPSRRTAEAPGAIGADAKAAAPKAAADAAQPASLDRAVAHRARIDRERRPRRPPAPQAAAVPLAGVAIEIASKALAGKNHFEIRLDPPELGRIEVRLDVDRDGNVTSRMIADRSDTLDLLRRDASGLERALQDAGLKTADNGLQFSLRDQSTGQQQANGGSDTARLVVEDENACADRLNHATMAGSPDKAAASTFKFSGIPKTEERS